MVLKVNHQPQQTKETHLTAKALGGGNRRAPYQERKEAGQSLGPLPSHSQGTCERASRQDLGCFPSLGPNIPISQLQTSPAAKLACPEHPGKVGKPPA